MLHPCSARTPGGCHKDHVPGFIDMKDVRLRVSLRLVQQFQRANDGRQFVSGSESLSGHYATL